MKKHLFFILFVLLNVYAEVVLAGGYRNTDDYICQKYPDGGVITSPLEYCASMCYNLYFPPSEEDKKRQGNWRKCRDMTNNGASDSCPPVGEYLESSTNTFRELNRINQTFKRCPNNEEYELLKQAYTQEKIRSQARADELLRQSTEKNNLRASRMHQVCRGLPKIDSKYIELISRKFESHPNSINLERVSLDSDSNCIATFYYPKGVISCKIEDVDSAGLLLLKHPHCQ